MKDSINFSPQDPYQMYDNLSLSKNDKSRVDQRKMQKLLKGDIPEVTYYNNAQKTKQSISNKGLQNKNLTNLQNLVSQQKQKKQQTISSNLLQGQGRSISRYSQKTIRSNKISQKSKQRTGDQKLNYIDDIPIYPNKGTSAENRELLQSIWWEEIQDIFYRKPQKEELEFLQETQPIKQSSLLKLTAKDLQIDQIKDNLLQQYIQNKDLDKIDSFIDWKTEFYERFCQTDFEKGKNLPMKNNNFLYVIMESTQNTLTDVQKQEIQYQQLQIQQQQSNVNQIKKHKQAIQKIQNTENMQGPPDFYMFKFKINQSLNQSDEQLEQKIQNQLIKDNFSIFPLRKIQNIFRKDEQIQQQKKLSIQDRQTSEDLSENICRTRSKLQQEINQDENYIKQNYGSGLSLYEHWRLDLPSLREVLRQQKYICKKYDPSNKIALEYEYLYLKRKLDKQIELNNLMKQKVLKKYQNNKGMLMEQILNSGKQEQDIIIWNTILCNIRSGFKDKDLDILDYYFQGKNKAKQLDFLEIDCKICFNQYTSESNPVVYCSDCDTSFHKFCYGIKNLPEDDYYCEQCTENRLKKSGEKLVVGKCFICQKSGLPIKKINDVWYHVLCLIITNHVIIKDSQYVFRNNKTRNTLQQLIDEQKEKQENKFCEICASSHGYLIKCNCCDKSIHPYCGYLNGSYFQFDVQQFQQIENNKEQQLNSYQILNNTLQDIDEKYYQQANLKYFCRDHCEEKNKLQRNNIIQVYLRRYAINHNQTVKLQNGFEEFYNMYKQDIEKKEQKINKKIQKLLKQGLIQQEQAQIYQPASKSEENIDIVQKFNEHQEISQKRKLQKLFNIYNQENKLPDSFQTDYAPQKKLKTENQNINYQETQNNDVDDNDNSSNSQIEQEFQYNPLKKNLSNTSINLLQKTQEESQKQNKKQKKIEEKSLNKENNLNLNQNLDDQNIKNKEKTSKKNIQLQENSKKDQAQVEEIEIEQNKNSKNKQKITKNKTKNKDNKNNNINDSKSDNSKNQEDQDNLDQEYEEENLDDTNNQQQTVSQYRLRNRKQRYTASSQMKFINVDKDNSEENSENDEIDEDKNTHFSQNSDNNSIKSKSSKQIQTKKRQQSNSSINYGNSTNNSNNRKSIRNQSKNISISNNNIQNNNENNDEDDDDVENEVMIESSKIYQYKYHLLEPQIIDEDEESYKIQ